MHDFSHFVFYFELLGNSDNRDETAFGMAENLNFQNITAQIENFFLKKMRRFPDLFLIFLCSRDKSMFLMNKKSIRIPQF